MQQGGQNARDETPVRAARYKTRKAMKILIPVDGYAQHRPVNLYLPR